MHDDQKWEKNQEDGEKQKERKKRIKKAKVLSRIQEETNRWRQIRAMMVNREGRGAGGRGGGAPGGGVKENANCWGGASRIKWEEELEEDSDGPGNNVGECGL